MFAVTSNQVRSLNSLVASNLSNVNFKTDFDFPTADEAFESAEVFTELGFEVSVPKSLDGQTFSFTVMQ